VTRSNPCIAVVDDEEHVRTMLRRVLNLDGYEVACFATGAGFLESLSSRIPDCVILDVHMSGLSGLEVQARLTASGTNVAAIFITASDDRSLDKAVQDAHGLILLRKPFASEELLGALRLAVPRAQEMPTDPTA
jgi:FixJ family two-component response regulator